MSRFLTPLVAELVSYDRAGRPIWELQEDLVYQSDRFGQRRAKAGFRTNYASVPRLPVVFLVAGDRAHAPAALHDDGYTHHYDLTRAEWDLLFLEALGAKQVLEVQKPVHPLLAKAMYQGVHLFGRSAWGAPTTVWQPRQCPGLAAGALEAP